ncbi:MAG TPA: hypothetical protein VLH58_13600 [Candidatus Methylomirabilis sp.]|nr:hypothetical protein [Candidatus Methylomirabilis sp.]HSD50434.1 hypothetical protein [Candidatus Methylomirabilis sp.]
MLLDQATKEGHAVWVTMQRHVGHGVAQSRRGLLIAATNLLGPSHHVKGKGSHVLPTISLLVMTLVGFSACAGPVPHLATPSGTAAIVQETPGLRLSVEVNAWQGRPSSLASYVLPFLVILKNTGAAPVIIARTDFSLLDDANRQYLPLFPAEVVTMIGSSGSGTAVYPSVGVGGTTGSRGSSTGFGIGLGTVFGGYGTDTRDIIPQALAEGPIQPSAEVRGFLYFPLPAPGYKSLRLVFAPPHPPGQPRLDFEFLPAGQ